MIPVSKPFLPPKKELFDVYEGIYDRNWLTNHGPIVNEFEKRFPEAINYDGHFSYVNNGTIALQIAIRVLDLKGEILTTPFSYVATSSSIVWEGCKPIFVDIDARTCNIDVGKIEASITKDTRAILATHVYGNACEIDKINKIAKKHNLKVIYDAAHCVGTSYKGKPIFEYGDIVTTSFHATKLFQTVEGGGIFTQDKVLFHKISYHRNFGHNGQEKFWGLGVNGKNSEFHAAMGVVSLGYLKDILIKRKEQWLNYQQLFHRADFELLKLTDEQGFNYAYFPIFLKNEEVLKKVKTNLEAQNIYPRRYFYPVLSSLNYLPQEKNFPVAESIAGRVLTLPLFHDLTEETQNLIAKIVLDNA